MIHVKLQNRLISNKNSVIAFLPLFIWLFVFLGILFTMFATSFYWLVPVLGIEFLCIIPVFLMCKVRVKKAFDDLDNQFYEADLEVKNGKLYYGNMDLKVKYDKRNGIISLKHVMVSGKYMTRAYSFWSIVCDEDKETFLELCDFYHLKIKR